MAIDPSISLAVQAPKVLSPIDALQKNVSVADMLSQMSERQQLTRQRNAAQPLIDATNAAKLKDIQDGKAYDQIIHAHTSYDTEAKDIAHDDAGIATDLHNANLDHLIPVYQQQQAAIKQAQRAQGIQEAADVNEHIKTAGTIADNINSLDDDDKKAAAWENGGYDALLKAHPIPALAKELSPKWTPHVAETLAKISQEKKTITDVADGLKAAKEAADIAETNARAAKLKQETEHPKPEDYAPGTLVITKDKDGNEISRETVPVKPEKLDDATVKTNLVEEAYGQLKLGGKTRDQMTAPEKVAAANWDKARTPEKQSDQDKLMALYRSGKPEDLALFKALKGDVDKGPTIANKTSILNAIIGASKDDVTKKIDPAAFSENRKLYVDVWPDVPKYGKEIENIATVPGANATSITAPAKPSVTPNPNAPTAPKSGAPVYKKGTSQILGYFDGYASDGKIKLKAKQ